MTLRILGGKWKGRAFKSPPESITRPTQAIVRQAIFNIAGQEIEGAKFLDLFAGSGAMGLEALSRGSQRVVFIEQNRLACQIIRKNIDLFEARACAEILQMDVGIAIQRLEKKKESFEIIYIDPPYAFASTISPILDEIVAQKLLAPHGVIFIEMPTSSREIKCELLSLKSSRRFGTTRIDQFIPV